MELLFLLESLSNCERDSVIVMTFFCGHFVCGSFFFSITIEISFFFFFTWNVSNTGKRPKNESEKNSLFVSIHTRKTRNNNIKRESYMCCCSTVILYFNRIRREKAILFFLIYTFSFFSAPKQNRKFEFSLFSSSMWCDKTANFLIIFSNR